MPSRESPGPNEPAAAGRERRALRDPVLEGLSAGVAVYDAARRLVAFNAAYAGLFGLDAAWLESAPEFGVVLAALRDARMLPEVPDFAAWRAAQLARFAADGVTEEVLHLPDGRSLRHAARRHREGGLILIYEDVSRSLALEREHNAEEAVRRVTLDALADGLAAFAGDGRLRLANAAFGALWNLDGAAVAGRHVNDLSRLMGAALSPAGIEALARLVAAMHGRNAVTERLDRADGRVLEGASLALPDGAVLLTFRDVTDRLRVESALAERDAAFAASERAKTAFIANVSFEVRGPLNALSGFAELLADEAFGPLNARQRSYAEAIRDSALGLSSVLDDILDLAAMEAGQTALAPEPLDVPLLLAAVLALVRERARARQVGFALDCPPDLGTVPADPARLKQVLLELLDNALAHTPPRGTVTVSARRHGGGVEIAVADTGPGIAKADRERVFMPFERGAPGDGAAGGAGLGLAVARRFVEMHGGRIDLASRPGRGTTLRVWLPGA